jgi:hypothetical protein
MVSQRELNSVVEQVNASYSSLVKRVAELEKLLLTSTDKKESK